MRDKLLFFLWFFGIVCLFLYSYTQVDLNLTLSQNPAILSFQRYFQQIGFFQRPLSTLLFVSITTLLFVLYIIFLRAAKKRHITKKQIWMLVLFAAIFLNFSYNAFSYDLFNYIFDAKIITHYHLNPYMHRALDFPGDPMLLFMHWTHRLYPYGPTWLGLSVPLSFLGIGFFLPTLFLFKTLTTACFLGTAYFIGKILKLISPAKGNFGILFFALNSLVILERLVFGHNDIAMMFFAILAFYFLVNKKTTSSIASLILSIGVKFATLFLIPVWIYALRSKKTEWEKVIFLSVVLMTIAVLVATFRLNFQSWYWLYVLPFVSLIPKKYNLYLAGIVVSVFGVLNYVPFLYLGNLAAPVPTIIFWSSTISILLSLFIILTKYRKI